MCRAEYDDGFDQGKCDKCGECENAEPMLEMIAVLLFTYIICAVFICHIFIFPHFKF